MWVHIVFNEKNNGILIADFALTNNKVIMSTLFPYKNIHKCNWRAPHRKMKSQIKRVLINARHIKDAMNVRSCKRNNCNSDHFLVQIKLKPKILITGIRSSKKTERYDITKLNQTSVSLKYREKRTY